MAFECVFHLLIYVFNSAGGRYRRWWLMLLLDLDLAAGCWCCCWMLILAIILLGQSGAFAVCASFWGNRCGHLAYDITWCHSLGKPRTVVVLVLIGVFILFAVVLGTTFFPFSLQLFLVDLDSCWLSCSLRQYATWESLGWAQRFWQCRSGARTHTIECYSMFPYVGFCVQKCFPRRRSSFRHWLTPFTHRWCPHSYSSQTWYSDSTFSPCPLVSLLVNTVFSIPF